MEAPLCFACNQRHWSTQPCPARADVRAEQQKQIRQKLVAKAVTNNQPTVTKIPTDTVTKNTPAVTTNPISVTPKPISVTNFRDAPAPSQKENAADHPSVTKNSQPQKEHAATVTVNANYPHKNPRKPVGETNPPLGLGLSLYFADGHVGPQSPRRIRAM
jgi:hypothetical protein